MSKVEHPVATAYHGTYFVTGKRTPEIGLRPNLGIRGRGGEVLD